MTSLKSWIALDIDSSGPAVRARWLDRVLASFDLPEVIIELAAISGDHLETRHRDSESARSWLGDHAVAVLEGGMERLEAKKLEELFREPSLLAGIQELVLTEGGAYWESVLRQNASLEELAEVHRDTLVEKLGLVGSSMPARDHSLPIQDFMSVRRGMGKTMAFAVSLAAAAAILIIAGFSVPRPRNGHDQADVGRSPEGGWPTHPWQALGGQESGDATASPELHGSPLATMKEDLVGVSRKWTRQLEDARSLSATQVRAAATHARDAVKAIDAFAAIDDAGLSRDIRQDLTAKCRSAEVELNQVHDIVGAGAAGDVVVRAKQDIVRVLGDVESAILGEVSRESHSPRE